jgi:hypothetical protein
LQLRFFGDGDTRPQETDRDSHKRDHLITHERTQKPEPVTFREEYAGAARWLASLIDRGDLTDDRGVQLWHELAAEIEGVRPVAGGVHELTIASWKSRVQSEVAEDRALEDLTRSAGA